MGVYFNTSKLIKNKKAQIFNNITESSYDPPYNREEIESHYGKDMLDKLMKDPAHRYRADTGIELIHKEPSKEELERIWSNWNMMSDSQKKESDKQCKLLFGKTNEQMYKSLIKENNMSVITESAIEKKYKCPYCEFKATRDELVPHIEEEHEDMIPKDYTAPRIVFDTVNNKVIGRGAGVCRVCKKPTSWNDKNNKYNVLCDNPKCRETLRKTALSNMIKVYNKPTLLDDAEHQEKMLANRGISGKYKFSDGGSITYTGSYEKKALEFFDQVLEVPSKDIMAPGPTFKYQFNGKELTWITDIYYIPLNLVIEVKDGGDNPNNRSMPVYREKQVCKEKMITDLGTYNYLRLTNNNFEQLFLIIAELKAQFLDDSQDNKKAIVRIHESMAGTIAGALPNSSDMSMKKNDCYIINYTKKNTFTKDGEDGIGISFDDTLSKVTHIDDKGKVKTDKIEDFAVKFEMHRYNDPSYVYENTLLKVYNLYKDCDKAHTDGELYEALTGKPMLSADQIKFDHMFDKIDLESEANKIKSFTETVVSYAEALKKDKPMEYFSVLSEEAYNYKSKVLADTNEAVTILQDIDGYFAINTLTKTRSESFNEIYDITDDIIKSII